jgi:phosphotransferase system enzyme I (PtsI)
VNAKARALPRVPRDAVLVAHDLAPSDIATLRPGQVAGFATELGGMTSHVAIMARSRGIPAVVGLRGLLENVAAGEPIIVDGIKGLIEVSPRPEIVEGYRGKQRRLQEMEHLHAENREMEATTLDGFTLSLGANLELPEEVEFARERGARAIGLFRTEFFFMTHARMPAEEEQLKAYDAVAARMHPLPVIIRTLDVGGDKVASYLGTTRERNPFYGLRGIRFLIEHRDLFKTQLRAIFRASARGNVKVMFPMIAGLEEIRISRDLSDEVREELTAEGLPFDPSAEIGIMVEVPSAVLMADRLAREVDFFSIGSNDLIQYTLAVDRTNEKTAHLYDPFHPAFLRAVDQTARAARAAGAWAGICGEITSDPLFIPLLIGLGFEELSTSPYYIPEIKAVIRSFRKKDAEEIAAEALQFSTSGRVRAFLKEKVKACLPELESLIPGKENHGG